MQILPESPQTIHESVESTIAVPQNEDVMSAEVQTLEFRPAVDESDETTAAVATVDQTQHAISAEESSPTVGRSDETTTASTQTQDVISGKSALIIGATGQVGRHVLKNLLASSEFSRVGEYGRRVTPIEQLTTGKEKLEQKVIDFEKIEESGLKDGKWDVVYITLGTTRPDVNSNAEFERIDREYVTRAAREARNAELDSQRIVYCSSVGADPSSVLLYPRCKGFTEEDLASLGYADTIIFRPGIFYGANREKDRGVLKNLAAQVSMFASMVTDNAGIDVGTMGKSFYLAGLLGSQALPVPTVKGGNADKPFTIIKNDAALNLAGTQK